MSAVALQLAGFVAMSVGAFMLAVWFGFIVSGMLAFGLGLYLEGTAVKRGDDARTST